MEILVKLQDDVLQTQVCQECFRYLSVGPVTINARGTVICGRCNEGHTESLFNLFADCFLYKCTNHLNGCDKILAPAQMADHELVCPYLPQDCFFCSFSGNLSQILNHCLVTHLRNVSNDGKFSFILSRKASYNKVKLLLSENDIFLVIVNMSETVFRSQIWPMTKIEDSKLKHYKFNFFSPNQLPVITDFEPVYDGSLSVFEKSIDQLISVFDSDVPLCCQIILENVNLDTKALEVQNRYGRLHRMEEQLRIFESETRIERQELYQKSEQYGHVMSILKMMSCSLLECLSCKNIGLADIYYCPKMHAYCKNCLSMICKKCKKTRKFKQLVHLEHFTVSCDYPDCDRNLTLKDYLSHKPVCLKRPYKCPLEDCNETIFSVNRFIEHWHCEKLKLQLKEFILFEKYESREFYWMLNYDLYHVMVKFEKGLILVLINENNVLSINTSFNCIGLYSDNNWYTIKSLEWCNKFNAYYNGENEFTRLQITEG